MNLSFLSPRGRMLLSLAIFGTIGLVRRFIPLGSVPLAFLRAALGCLTLLVLMQTGHIPFHWDKLKERAPKLLLSGLLLGLDWVFFFEAFNHTTVAIATLCYYMAPVFMLAAAPWYSTKPSAAGNWCVRPLPLGACCWYPGCWAVTGTSGISPECCVPWPEPFSMRPSLS